MFLRRPALPAMSSEEVAGREDLQVIDVRDDFEWRAGRIEGARHVPLQELPRRLAEIDRSRPSVMVCRSGSRSAQATQFLVQQGYEVSNLTGGVTAWVTAGLPLTCPDGRPGRVV